MSTPQQQQLIPRSQSPQRASSSHGVHRPTLSQKSKRHVVAISDALRDQQQPVSVSAPSLSQVAVYHQPTQSASPNRSRALGESCSSRLAVTFGVLVPHDAHLNATLDEECLSEAPSAIANALPERTAPFLAKSIQDLRRSTPVLNGFDMMDQSIVQLVHRLPESTLEDKFRLISRWIDSYHVDVVPRKLAAQLSLLLGISAERSKPDFEKEGVAAAEGGEVTALHPSFRRLRAASSVDVEEAGDWMGQGEPTQQVSLKVIISSAFALHQLMLVLVRLKPILGPVVMRTLQGVYDSIFMAGNPLKTLSNEIIDATATRETFQKTLRHFQLRTYFQEARDSTRRVAAVQEFVGQFEKVRRRQMMSVTRQIEGRSTIWVSVCFKLWRGAIARHKEERQRSAAHLSLQAEKDKLTTRIATLEDIIASRDKTIADLHEKMRGQAEKADIIHKSLRYDIIMMESHFESSKATIASNSQRIAELERECHQLREVVRSSEVALSSQLDQLQESLWRSKSSCIAREALRACDTMAQLSQSSGLSSVPQLCEDEDRPTTMSINGETAHKWVTTIARRAIEEHRSEWSKPDNNSGGGGAEGGSTESGGLPTPVGEVHQTDGDSAATTSEGERGGGADDQITANRDNTNNDGGVEEKSAEQDDPVKLLCERYLNPGSGTSVMVSHGHDSLNMAALALVGLFEHMSISGISWEGVCASFLTCNTLLQKITTLKEWCDALRLPMGCVLHEYVLLEASNYAVTALFTRLMQVSVSPLARFGFDAVALPPDASSSAFLFSPVKVALRAPLPPPQQVVSLSVDNDLPPQGGSSIEFQNSTVPIKEDEGECVILDPLQRLRRHLTQSSRQDASIVSQCDRLLIQQLASKLSFTQMETAYRPLSIAEAGDRAPFTVTAKDIAGLPNVPQDEATLSALQGIIRMHYLFLRQSFLGYAGLELTANAVSSTMSDFGLTKMMRDARVGVPGSVDASVIKSLAGDGLSAKRFCLALIQIASLRFPQKSFPDALVTLINRFRTTLMIQQLDSNLLTPLRENLTFKDLLEDLRPDLMKVFRRYAVEAPGNNRLSALEANKMIQELKMNDDLLSTADVSEAFQLMGPVGGTLAFEQFCWFVCVLGALRIRQPWMSVSSRVTRFVFDNIFGPLQKKLQIQVVSL